MKITEKELRMLIRESISESSSSILNEGVFDAAENWATTLLGHAGVGDAAALIKAVTLDGGRVAMNLKQLSDSVRPFGLDTLIQIGDRQPSEIDTVSQAIQSGTAEEKENIKEQVYDTAESVKKFAVSLVSAFPDAVISGPIAGIITTMPIEKFLIAGADQLAKIVEMYKDFKPDITSGGTGANTGLGGLSPIGPLGGIMGGMPGMGGGSTPSFPGISGMGDPIEKAEEIMGDLPSALRYLSQIMEASESQDEKMSMLASAGTDTAKTLATDVGADAIKSIGSSFLTESRLKKLAGIS